MVQRKCHYIIPIGLFSEQG